MNSARTSSRRSYGKGYYDGLRAAGLQTGGDFMNRKKFTEIYDGLSTQPRDVYDSVPIKTSYSIGQIMEDMNRRGVAQSKTVVENCLSMMTKNGLVVQEKAGYFLRQKVVDDVKKEKQIDQKPEQKQSPSAILNLMAEKARQLAEELEYAAIEIEQEFQNSEAKSEQLKQLKSLLKGIAD